MPISHPCLIFVSGANRLDTALREKRLLQKVAQMKKFFLISFGLLVLVIASFFAFYEAEPPPRPLIPAPADEKAASELQAAIDADYCSVAQQALAQTSIEVTNEIHLNFDSFVKSKPSTDPMVTHQFLHYLPVEINAEERAFPAIVSCKLKTAERINQQVANAAAGPDLSCRHLIERDVRSVLANMDRESLAYQPEDIVYAEDDMANQGRTWFAPWPYSVAGVEAGKLLWQAKAMLIGFSRFLGTHDCHLPTLQYIRGVLLGDIEKLLAPVAPQRDAS
jgi:hypothetical protein